MDNLKQCPSCDSKKLVLDRRMGEVTCQKCGLVVEDIPFDATPEWRNKEDSRAQIRAEGKLTFTQADMGIGGKINPQDLKKVKGKGKRIFKKFTSKGNFKA